MNRSAQESVDESNPFFDEYNRTFWLWSLLARLGHNKLTLKIASQIGNGFLQRKSAQALMNISKKWTMPLHDWKAALNRFSI